MSETNFWGSLISELRLQHKLSQRKLSEKTTVNRRTLRAIEQGTTSGDIDLVEKLLKFFGYELEVVSVESLKRKNISQELEDRDPLAKSKRAIQRILSMR